MHRPPLLSRSTKCEHSLTRMFTDSTIYSETDRQSVYKLEANSIRKTHEQSLRDYVVRLS